MSIDSTFKEIFNNLQPMIALRNNTSLKQLIGTNNKKQPKIYHTYANSHHRSMYPNYSAIGGESLRIARASKNLESFSTAIKPFIARMSRQGISIGKINNLKILRYFNKYQGYFSNVCQSKQDLLHLVS